MEALLTPSGVGPVLLSVEEVSALIGRSRSTIYQDEKNGTFPQRIKLGSSTRWKKAEVLAWIEEQAAKRDRG
ncbi:MAG: AlpA family phage regulatory protein [Alphaproteobacteria bacterium]|nr:AlpA family phage regulatory protein [Alphaproteobacteria bacterium]MBU1757115.1 AlpA family phage regulatory protein [Alphaproteobacteria bacterium]